MNGSTNIHHPSSHGYVESSARPDPKAWPATRHKKNESLLHNTTFVRHLATLVAGSGLRCMSLPMHTPRHSLHASTGADREAAPYGAIARLTATSAKLGWRQTQATPTTPFAATSATSASSHNLEAAPRDAHSLSRLDLRPLQPDQAFLG